jgi:hypothetical protein
VVLTSFVLPHRPHDIRRRHFVGSVQVGANDFTQVFNFGEIEQAFLDSFLVRLENIGGVELDAFGRQAFHVLQCLDRYFSGSFIGVPNHGCIVRIFGNLSLTWECTVWSARSSGDGSVVRLLDPGDELDLKLIFAGVHVVQHVCELEHHLHVLDWVCFVGVRICDLLPMVKSLSK